jgi:hypothetical protein
LADDAVLPVMGRYPTTGLVERLLVYDSVLTDVRKYQLQVTASHPQIAGQQLARLSC